jgi:hypothetical protein
MLDWFFLMSSVRAICFNHDKYFALEKLTSQLACPPDARQIISKAVVDWPALQFPAIHK